jgi:hypothetical protein
MDTLHKRGRPFAVGNRSSKGRPDGSRNKVTLACEELMEGEGEAITRQAIDMAKEGDHFAMKLCMDRFYPPRRERRLKLDLPEIHAAGDVQAAFQIVLQALAKGDIDTGQAEHVTKVLEFGRKSIETHDLANRIAELENKVKENEESDERRAA